MNYGICDQALVPVRVQPGDRQEMTNQLLFGDMVIIKGQVKDWLLVESFDDQYEGWTDSKQILPVSKELFNELINEERHYALDLSTTGTYIGEESNYLFTCGAHLPFFRQQAFRVIDRKGEYAGEIIKPGDKVNPDELLRIAYKYHGAPYLWGGRSPFGIDCSGFVQVVFRMVGIMLPRDASQQVLQGEPLNFVDEALPGDLAFFGNEEGEIIHVGMVVNDRHIIHASGKVRVDKLDHQGIYNEGTRKYTHNLRLVKRFI